MSAREVVKGGCKGRSGAGKDDRFPGDRIDAACEGKGVMGRFDVGIGLGRVRESISVGDGVECGPPCSPTSISSTPTPIGGHTHDRSIAVDGTDGEVARRPSTRLSSNGDPQFVVVIGGRFDGGSSEGGEEGGDTELFCSEISTLLDGESRFGKRRATVF